MNVELSRAAAHAVNVWLIPSAERDRFVGVVGNSDTVAQLPEWARAFITATEGVTAVRVLPDFQFTPTGFTGT